MPGKPIEAGKLRHRIEIQGPTTTTNTFGEVIQEPWTTLVTRWASVEPLSGRELWIAQQTAAQTTHKVTLRYWAGLTPKHRFKFGTRVFEIESVIVADEVQNRQECLCIEQIAGA